ncbi:MAG TPA: DUF6314 family protein [Kiloniellaceae bacterium]
MKAFLQGEWSLERRVQDRRAAQDGRLSGAAAFTADGSGLLCREEGRLAIGAHEGPALQSYRYVFSTAARAAVHFADGRFFHDLDLTAGAWRCTHLCDPDRYDGDFSALSPDAWRVVWRVAGPRKDLVLDSRYRRRL